MIYKYCIAILDNFKYLTHGTNVVKGKDIPLQAWEGSWGSRRLRLLDLLDTRHMKVVRSSPLRTGRLHPQEFPGTHF